MSDLHYALLAAGALLVVAVVGYNWMQQRRLRRQAEDAFRNDHPDVLMGGAAQRRAERVEPRFASDEEPDEVPEPMRVEAEEAAPAPAEASPATKPAAPPPSVGQRPSPASGSVDGFIDFLGEVAFGQPVDVAVIGGLLRRRAEFGKNVLWCGLNEDTAAWDDIRPGGAGRYRRVRAGLQLVDRSGPVSEVALAAFRDMMTGLANEHDGVAACPDPREAYARATTLDQFCAEVDVVVGLNVVSRDERAFPGTKIRALAESNGLRLEPTGGFSLQDDAGRHRFSLVNFEDTPFRQDAMAQLATRGVTFVLDVPRVQDGEAAFQQMTRLARTFAATLGGRVVDDNRMPLDEPALERIRERVAVLQSRMAEREIPPGGGRAQRLFS